MIIHVTLYYLALLLVTAVEGTDVSTFEDATCSTNVNNFNGPNGYPDGACTPLNILPGQSFSVVGLDPGCSVTIYGSDSESGVQCSSETKKVAQLASCYNSTWVYYSIDGCDFPSTLPSSTATPTPTATPKPTDATRPPIGVIVGGIVGGVSSFCIIFVAAMFFFRRRHRSDKILPPPPSYELSEDGQLRELPPMYPEKTANIDLYAHETHHEVAELGPQSTYIPPVELPDNFVAETKKGRDSLV